jgi:hypothetical protein
MFRESITRRVKVLLIAGFLVSAPAAAGPSESLEGSFWAQSWSWLQSLWREEAAQACGGDAGMCIDPDGALACAGGGDRGACIDPDG